MTQGPSDPRSRFEQQAEGALNAAMKAFGKARVRAGELAHQNRAKIDQTLDKAGKFVDDKTGGKYHDTVEKVKAQAAKGVEFVENERHGGTSPGTPTPGTTPPGPSGSPGAPGGTPPMPSPIPPYTPPAAPGAPGAPSAATPPPPPPPAPGAPGTEPAEPARGWHRGPNGEWVRDSPQP